MIFIIKGIELHDISLPSGVYSELEKAEITGSVLFSFNDVQLRWIGLENWTYTLQFNLTTDDFRREFVILTFNGLDTLAKVYLNEELIGLTNNMFVRYRFDVLDSLVSGTNTITINFQSPVEGAKNLNAKREKEVPPACPPEVYNGECHVNLLRKMQASFAWDWGLAAPSTGIWKSVQLEAYDSIVIRDVTYKLIDGPLEPEVRDDCEDCDEEIEDIWTLKIFVHIETGMKAAEFDGLVQCELV